LLTAVAMATDRIRLCPLVFNNDLRYPAVLAQELASLDIISGARLEIGIGAGWNEREYRAAGIEYDRPGIRIERLTEAIAILRGLFADGPFSHTGRFYTITELDGQPKPVQRPHPPFLIGGGGRRTLELAGREAQIVGLAPRILPGIKADPRSITVDGTAEKIEWVRDVAGDRFDEIVFNVYPSQAPVTVTRNARSVARKAADVIRKLSGLDITEDEVLESPHVFIGSIAGLAEKLIGLRERLGISSFMVGGMGPLDPLVERLAGT
jgi:probable F420-dependent oxidoreductase